MRPAPLAQAQHLSSSLVEVPGAASSEADAWAPPLDLLDLRRSDTPDLHEMMAAFLTFPETEIPADSVRTVEVRPPATWGRVVPTQLVLPEGSREGFKIRNVRITNAGHDLPFFYERDFHGELFDGDDARDVPYGRLPAVPADLGSPLKVEVWNTTLRPKTFRAHLKLESAARPRPTAGSAATNEPHEDLRGASHDHE